MQRVCIHNPLHPQALITLDKAQSHYVVNVLRLRLNDKLKCFNGMDGEWEMHLTDTNPKACQLQATLCTRPQHSTPALALAFCPIKKGRVEYLIEKATELGVSDLFPVISQRTIVKPKQPEKWHHTLTEAAEQCERLDLPTLHPIMPLAQWCTAQAAQWLPLFADETGSGQPIDALSLPNNKPPALIIGPEGGFTTEEATMLRALPQAQTVHLGPRILRADTAAIAGISILQSKQPDWQHAPRIDALP